MLIEHLVGREVVLAALGTAQRFADLVLGAQVVHIALFALKHLVAELTHKLKTQCIICG